MVHRRKFIQASALGSLGVLFSKMAAASSGLKIVKGKPVVISTWDAGLEANKAAWEILGNGGRALDNGN
jgi:N4-(beta-N-acetylglucosaminyl)-L-asparaginase